MKHIALFLFFFSILLVGLFFETSHLLGVYHINPNLVLIIFVLIVCTVESLIYLVPLFIAVGVFIMFTTPFWIWSYLLCGVLVAGIVIAKRFLTGNRFADFISMLVVATALFYIGNNINHFTDLSFVTVFKSVFYTSLVGSLGWLVMRLPYFNA